MFFEGEAVVVLVDGDILKLNREEARDLICIYATFFLYGWRREQ